MPINVKHISQVLEVFSAKKKIDKKVRRKVVGYVGHEVYSPASSQERKESGVFVTARRG